MNEDIPIRVQSRQKLSEQTNLTDIDTTKGSFLHRLAPTALSDQPLPAIRLFLICVGGVACTWLLMLILSLLGPKGGTELLFLYDWNVYFMFMVSFPLLLIFTITDQHLLTSSLHRVLADGVVVMSDVARVRSLSKWEQRFRAVNIGSLLVGVIVGAVIAKFNYNTYSPAEMGYWAAANGQFLPAGYVYLFCVVCFYTLVTLYVVRSLAMAFFLRSIANRAELRVVPFHPDKCGGLRPVGRLGLRNEYVLSVMGINLLLLIYVSFINLEMTKLLSGLIIAASAAYFILGPLVFVAPLLPFRGAMLRSKQELMEEVALRLKQELARVRAALDGGVVSKEDDELMDRLRKLGRLIDELPIWPFDAGTLRKFATAYVAPLLGAAGYKIFDVLFKALLPGT